MKRLISAVTLVTLLMAVFATAAFAQMTASVTASDQDSDGATVTVDQVVSDGAGFIVIHADNDGAPGEVIGHAAVADGENNDVVVELDRPAEDGEVLWAMLHTDAGEAGVYEFPGDDGPVQVDGEIVMQSFTVTVGEMMDDEAAAAAEDMEDEDMDDEEEDSAPETLPTTGATTSPTLWIAALVAGFALLVGAFSLRRQPR